MRRGAMNVEAAEKRRFQNRLRAPNGTIGAQRYNYDPRLQEIMAVTYAISYLT
jgi:hypothetical protein